MVCGKSRNSTEEGERLKVTLEAQGFSIFQVACAEPALNPKP